jgi:hypothetical protein
VFTSACRLVVSCLLTHCLLCTFSSVLRLVCGRAVEPASCLWTATSRSAGRRIQVGSSRVGTVRTGEPLSLLADVFRFEMV